MRKVRPQDVRQDFAGFVAERLAHFVRLEQAVAGSPHEKRDMSTLSETTLHAVYVGFERFVSDLFLAYMNRDFSQYQATVSARIATSTQGKFGAWAAGRTTFAPVAHLSVDRIESIVDQDSYNLTFKDVATMKQRAAEWLAVPHRNAIAALNDPDVRLIDTIHAIRNFVAHQSSSSKGRMNAALATVVTGPACPNAHLGRAANEVHDVGAFLKASWLGQRRITRYVNRIAGIAATL